jgi:hypothetical protein
MLSTIREEEWYDTIYDLEQINIIAQKYTNIAKCYLLKCIPSMQNSSL